MFYLFPFKCFLKHIVFYLITLTLQDNKELQKNLVEAVNSKVKPDERIDLGNKAMPSNNEIAVDGRPASSGSHATENIRNSLDEVCSLVFL
jgi:hypothetical protein